MRSDTFQALMGFVRDKMQMQHIYQPVMLNELLSHHGACSIDHIARAFLAHDDSQIEYYGEVTKRMPGDVLAKRGIVAKEKEGNKIAGYRLIGFESLSESEIAELLELCNQRLQTYLAKHGDSIWEHRSKSDGYIPGTLRYEIFKRARYRCELCGTPDGARKCLARGFRKCCDRSC